MNRCKGVSNKTGLHNSVWASVLVVLLGVCVRFSPWAQAASPKGENLLGVVKVLSVRKMTGKEYAKRVSDYIGATHVVRLRFEAPIDKNVFLYAPYCGKPSGYVLERSAGKVTWLAALRGENPSKSPGFKRLEAETSSCWLLMMAGAAYEWETETEPRAPTEEARSIFVKAGKDQEPVELISAWYTVSKDSQAPSTTR
jgi:hypothetical protein